MKRVLVWCGAVACILLGFVGASAQDPQLAAPPPACATDDKNPQILTCDHRVPPHLDCADEGGRHGGGHPDPRV